MLKVSVIILITMFAVLALSLLFAVLILLALGSSISRKRERMNKVLKNPLLFKMLDDMPKETYERLFVYMETRVMDTELLEYLEHRISGNSNKGQNG